MRKVLSYLLAAVLGLAAVSPTLAQDAVIEDFKMQPETRWRFFTDQVMGGVSTGGIAFQEEDGRPHARMTGRVSTANRGGFIQIRLELPVSPPEGTTGVRLVVRGNNQRYFVHLRTTGTLLPWQYYQAGFDVTTNWSEVRLPLNGFKASGTLLSTAPGPRSLKSIAVVAYGRDHEAQIDVREVGFY